VAWSGVELGGSVGGVVGVVMWGLAVMGWVERITGGVGGSSE
jgi:hypothetical protein